MMIFAILLMCGGAIFWWIGHEKDNRFRKGVNSGEVIKNVEDQGSDQTRDEIVSLHTQYSGLPAVPISPLQYDGWIEEVRKRIRMRSLGLTVQQETALQNHLNALQGARLQGVQTELQLQNALADLGIVKQSAKRRAEGADRIQAKQAELDLLKIDTEIVKMQQQLDEVKNPKARHPAPSRESREDRYFAEWHRLQDQRKRRLAACNGDPKCEGMVNRFFDSEEEQLKEGR